MHDTPTLRHSRSVSPHLCAGITAFPPLSCPIKNTVPSKCFGKPAILLYLYSHGLFEDLSCFTRNLGSRAAKPLAADSRKSEAGMSPAVWPGAQHMVLEKRYLLWIFLTLQFYLNPMSCLL